jgi:hypothetical protein
MYPQFEKPNSSAPTSQQPTYVLPQNIHTYFHTIPPTSWHPSTFALYPSTTTLSDFLASLRTIDRSGNNALSTYAGARRKFLNTEEGGLAMKEAELRLSLRVAHEQNGIRESVYSATVKGDLFAREAKVSTKRVSHSQSFSGT